jgi:hypothetical protein
VQWFSTNAISQTSKATCPVGAVPIIVLMLSVTVFLDIQWDHGEPVSRSMVPHAPVEVSSEVSSEVLLGIGDCSNLWYNE